jgi:sortase A
MRLVITRDSVRRILRWTQRVLFIAAASLLAYCAFVMIDAWKFQRVQRRQLERLLTVQHEAAFHSPLENATPAANGDLVGLIRIPRLDLSVIVIEGTSAKVLRRGAGHIPGTALPGHAGNVAISGHRDTFFLPLKNIRLNDVITLTTLLGEYSYQVTSTTVVTPYDVSVLNKSRNEILTLVTCYPFYFVGPAPDRFIVRARRVMN